MPGPRFLRLLARVLLPKRDREFIIGDLDELYAKRLLEEGRTNASLRYLRGVLASAVARRGGRGPASRTRRPTEAQHGGVLGDVAADLRQAVRSLRRRPSFTLMVVATLALGIGPATAVFAMVDQLLNRPLPGAANSESAAYLRFAEVGEFGGAPISLPTFDELRSGTTLASGMASYGLTVQHGSVGSGRPISVYAHVIYGDFFEVLGAEPASGRLLASSETGVDSNPFVVVISERLRDALFGSGSDVVGRFLQLGRHRFLIVGVVGGGFRGPERELSTDAWLPLSALTPLQDVEPERLSSGELISHRDFLLLPRPGATAAAIEAQTAAILEGLATSVPGSADNLTGLTPNVYEGLRSSPDSRELTSRTLRMLGLAAALILAIACANVANLLFVRNLARRGAVATQKVLGASTRRIALQHVLESALLTTLGVAGGLGIAWLIMRSFEGERLFRLALERFTLGWSMLGTVGALAVGTTVLFGALPAIFVGRFDLGAALRSADVRETGRMAWLRGTLSAGQIALTLALVAGGLLMFQTVANLRSVETGLDEEGVARLRLDTPSELDPTELNALYRRMLTDIEALPGVERAALDVFGPHGSSASGTIRVPGTPRADGRRALFWQVTPGWFDVFRVPPVHGRVFQDSDWQPFAPSGVVITESVARGLFGRTDVVGQTVLTRFTEEVTRPVLGVVADYTSLTNPGEPTDAFFVSFGEVRVSSSLSVLARTDRFGLEVAAGMRGIAEALLPDVPVPDPVLVSTTVERLHSQEAMIGRMLWILAAFGLLMSGVGLYGVIYFLVSHRRHELGIRLALGADAARLLRLVAGSAMRIVLVGMTVGLVVAYGLSRVLQSRFFGVTATDPASYAAAALVLATIAVLACVAPARTALSIDPVATLRQE